MIFKKLFLLLRPVDILVIIFLQALSIISLIYFGGTIESAFLIFVNLVIAVLIIVLSQNMGSRQTGILLFIQDWYPIPMIFFIFKEVHVIIQTMNANDWDNLFITIDRLIFGVDPTIWLLQLSSQVLTEILQIAYTSYYFIMIAVGIELYIRKERKKFTLAVFTVVYGFVLSYIGYILFPAVGPRFTLHDFYSLNTDLPGLWLTNSLRDFINAGESIPKDALNAIALAQRDVFPSGHTQMTLISMYLSHQYRLSCRYFIYLLGILLIISTVYLRYHYVIDLLGGAVFMIFTLWNAPKLFSWWESQIHKTKQQTEA